jgi:hypothetical protein
VQGGQGRQKELQRVGEKEDKKTRRQDGKDDGEDTLNVLKGEELEGLSPFCRR